jgi:hypothetical protein
LTSSSVKAREQVRASGEKLAELDKGGAEFFKGKAESFGLRKRGDGSLLAAQSSEWKPQSAGQWQAMREVFIATFEKDPHDRAVAMHVLNSAANPLESLEEHRICDSPNTMASAARSAKPKQSFHSAAERQAGQQAVTEAG